MRKMIAVVLALAAAGGGAWYWKGRSSKGAATQSVVVMATEAPIEETVEATGSVAPRNRVEVKPTIAGRIERLLVAEGQRVEQGQIIAWMSSTDRAAILDGARAQGPEALKKWEDTYKPTPLIAPLPGLIILRNVVEGQTVDQAAVIYAMSDVLIVLAQVDESDIGRVRVGMPARIVLDSYPNRSETGTVYDILYEGKNVSNVIQYSVKIKLDKVPDYYRSQMTANISFIVHRKEKALLVPAAAVRDRDGGKQVLTPASEPEGKDVWVDVKTGIENDASVEIVAGLKAGDPVVIRQARYVPQQAMQSSPLTFGGRGGQSNRQSGARSGGSRSR